jgi:hypothetical protein
MLLRVEVPPGLLRGVRVLLCYSHPTAAPCSAGGLEEYQRAPPHRGPVTVWNEREGPRLGRDAVRVTLDGDEVMA